MRFLTIAAAAGAAAGVFDAVAAVFAASAAAFVDAYQILNFAEIPIPLRSRTETSYLKESRLVRLGLG